jgi:hypothetical protein
MRGRLAGSLAAEWLGKSRRMRVAAFGIGSIRRSTSTEWHRISINGERFAKYTQIAFLE